MRLYAIGDLHLSFSDPENKTMDIFGGPWVNHFEKLKENWLKVVDPEDYVLLPGDFSWALKLEDAMPDFKWLSELPGKKIMIKGNHDLWWSSLKKMQVLGDSIIILQNSSFVTDRFAVAGSRGWICPEDPDFSESDDRKIYERELGRLRRSLESCAKEVAEKKAADPAYKLVVALHYPPSAFTNARSQFVDLIKEFGADSVVYGHLHGENGFKNGPEGVINGISYRLCSLDKLKCVPSLIVG